MRTKKAFLMATNLDTSSETLDRLVDDDDWYVCIAAIGNPNISPKTLDRLAHYEKKHYYFYCKIVKNSRTSQETLDYLANNESMFVRTDVAMNPRTSPKTLDRLSHDTSGWIQVSVAQNPSTSTETLDYLLTNHKGSPHALDICLEIARNPNASEKALDWLAKHEDFRICNAVANRRNK